MRSDFGILMLLTLRSLVNRAGEVRPPKPFVAGNTPRGRYKLIIKLIAGNLKPKKTPTRPIRDSFLPPAVFEVQNKPLDSFSNTQPA
jgi:hypothetical protein